MMKNSIAEIPYGCYWSTPFCKWQGSFQNLHSLKFAALVAKNELKKRKISTECFDHGILGTSVPQQQSFYGMPWVAGLMGADHLTGPSVAQACATGTRCLVNAEQEINIGLAKSTLIVVADRTSNGPHLYYPNPKGPGGTGKHEDWVLDNFASDPLGGHPMIQTAENVASKHGISTDEQHEVVLMRYEQYQDALVNDSMFQKRYMSLPFDVPTSNHKKVQNQIETDEGIATTTAEGLSALRPVVPSGTVTFGSQTHPADGNAGLVVARNEVAQELSKNPDIRIRVMGYGQARCELAYMPEATIPAVKAALNNSDLTMTQIDAVKSHNPFAVNDIIFSRETGYDLKTMNNYGCSLVYGHPQGVTSLRSIIELIEELVLKGGGIGLFFGCSAGDSAMATVIKVEDRSKS